MAESSNANAMVWSKEQDGPEPTQADGSPFTFLPPAPVVLFRKLATPKKVIMQGQPISPKSASKSKASRGGCPPSLHPSEEGGEESSCQEDPEAQSSCPRKLAGCDLSSLLTFDPESIEPATSKAGEEPSPGIVHGPLQRLKTLLSSSVETLENPEAVTGILEEIHPISQ
ncbi:hypothetical protein QYE76_010837 [Lolium multiflorum]|uniref:Uncharacterized protein n=1 Tax=Lolium multiflorum TaxID=4521 RepID=A0AAD8TY31_LOLMU|nr:hypothetical protein QYE76_010837 [Lolium multiflorum]